jgi:membrane associated rhomboid family serine protease
MTQPPDNPPPEAPVFAEAPAMPRITAYSRRQAMDWSLVLASQGIETGIEYSEAHGRWGLEIAPADYARSLEAIRLYRLENRRWYWWQQVPGSQLIFDCTALAWVLLVAFFFLLGEQLDLARAGMMSSMAVSQGEWWRLFTALWLHADAGHLAANATLGCLLLGLTMGQYGTGVSLCLACLAGVGGNAVAWWLAASSHRSLGASGLVMGCLGLLAVHTLSLGREALANRKYLLSGLAGGTMLFVLLGLAPGTDWLAHAGGFVTGILLGAAWILLFRRLRKRNADFLAGGVFLLAVIVPWWLALRHW